MVERLLAKDACAMADGVDRLRLITDEVFGTVKYNAGLGKYGCRYYFEEDDYPHVENFKKNFLSKGYDIEIEYNRNDFGFVTKKSKPYYVSISWGNK